MSDLKWHYRLEKAAEKQLEKLSPKDRARVFASILELAQADNPPLVQGVKHVKGSKDPKEWRQRWGRWRIFFEIRPGKIIELDVEYKGELIIRNIALDHTGY
jgi:mRNA-degrading endonuclease RelE of RelBE toxin-antitoxin system